jgi:predicted ATPase/class 3 adenylate cyclase/DNA-binding CsgD family transcriptional regulator
MSAIEWSELVVSGLPTGTVTLLLADVEGSTRLWESQPDEMKSAIARLDDTLAELVRTHGGVRPVEQGEGDSFVLAFTRASDAVACALDLQRAALAPIRLRIGINTGEVQLRDEGNYIGPAINRTARLRDLAHGGQTVLSGATEAMVLDHLPDDAWLADLGTHPLRDLPRPERVVQLCHPDIRNEFPPLRVTKSQLSHNLPAQLTSFVGRQSQIADVRELFADNRLVTLTGAGGAGKTRLALQICAAASANFSDGVWYIDLAPITNPAVVPITVARTLGLPDQPGRTPIETILTFFGDRKVLLLLDNCEHLLDACGQLVLEVLNGCGGVTILTTSREPIGVPGEVTWRVPSLTLGDEAVELFVDRARRSRADFAVDDGNADVVQEICRRLDGMPLAIELAASRVRALTLTQILDSLHDRFRLLTGGARTAVRRQQTLRASVDWSHALLTEPERVLFRRLAVFMGSFDLDAAQAVGGSSDAERFQLLDQISLLVDKSLVVAEDVSGVMRYRLLETVRQYALEKLGESGEADEVRTRHRDYYRDTAAALDTGRHPGDEHLANWAETEIDNLRAAFTWSREMSDTESALRLASALQELWFKRDRHREGLTAFDSVLTDQRPADVSPQTWIRAVADHAILAAAVAAPATVERAHEALTTARELDDPVLTARILTARGMLEFYDADASCTFFNEAAGVARANDAWWQVCEIRNMQAIACCFGGDPGAAQSAAEEARDVADAVGDDFYSAHGRIWRAIAMWVRGDLFEAKRALEELIATDNPTRGRVANVFLPVGYGSVLAHSGRPVEARSAARVAIDNAKAMGEYYGDTVYAVEAYADLAEGDADAARRAAQKAWDHTAPLREVFALCGNPIAEAALGQGDFAAAREWADRAAAVVPGCFRVRAHAVRARVALAQGDTEQAERDVYDALAVAAETRTFPRLPDAFDCLARLAADAGNHQNAARYLGAAEAVRRRTGQVRFPMYDGDHDAAVESVRDALGGSDFDAAWAEGAALSIAEAIAYAHRGRGERKRPSSGWGSLTPTELEVVRLVQEGLGNKDIAARLFISHRTVQTHLTHIYTKVGLTSRVQLAQEAARH